MNYEEVLNAIHSRKSFSSGGATLERIGRLMSKLGNPQNSYKTIHIAGTNGKGSVSAMTAMALREGGYCTGLFTSPYLIDFRERIQVDGKLIMKEELVACFQIVEAVEAELESCGYEPVNEFEFVTALGFVAFQRAKLDYAVIEVGLGGRTDPTNIIEKPEVCCITSISLDHTMILGNTIDKIAAEKAGIIKAGVPVVCAPQEKAALNVIKASAFQSNSELILCPKCEILTQSVNGISCVIAGYEVYLPFIGAYQVDNAASAFYICRTLGLNPEIICNALSKTSWPGRLQYIEAGHRFLIDAGHNIAGIKTLTDTLDCCFSGTSVITIMAMMKDKDYFHCIREIATRSRMLIGTSVGLPRSLKPDEVAGVAMELCPVNAQDSIEDAIQYAEKNANVDELILVCGSVYAAGEALRIIANCER